MKPFIFEVPVFIVGFKEVGAEDKDINPWVIWLRSQEGDSIVQTNLFGNEKKLSKETRKFSILAIKMRSHSSKWKSRCQN